MSATDRQNRLLVAEDWKKIYQSFKSADFQSYDFENLRRTMVDYIRQNYPEDFNDYIESSEYLALIDVIAFLGQSIAFRVDLNARENFLELAERRESVLRLAKLVSYNAKRSIAAKGLLKVTAIQTTEDVYDSNSRNLSGQNITWNDPSNVNWYDQFIKVANAAMPLSQQFGNPANSGVIYGIPTNQYMLQSTNTDVPIYTFSKMIAGRMMSFEVTSTTFAGQNYIYEESPKLGRKLSWVYRNDSHGYGSPGTGFFLNFVQGSLGSAQFIINQPRKNEVVDVDSTGINNTDVWLYRLDKDGKESEEWVQVPSVEGNNIIYNSINKNIKNIFSVLTRTNDAISLSFSDGTFGKLPYGTFNTYHRMSNGLSYTINTKDIRNITILVPYLSHVGQPQSLSLTLSLATSVSNAESTETNSSIKTNAPATYYTQNRMITGEDYNICPLSVSQQVLKVKAINRTSSGISRYFDLVDPTGKYSSTNLFADDGVIYKEEYESYVKFSYSSKTDIEGIIYNTLDRILKSADLRNFYYQQYPSFAVLGSTLNVSWHRTTPDVVSSTGYFYATATGDPQGVGISAPIASAELGYVKLGSLIKFISPEGKYFDTRNQNKLVDLPTSTTVEMILGASTYIWASVTSIVGDGTTEIDGIGPITLNVDIDTGAIVTQIIPKFRITLDLSVVTTMIDLISENKMFGLRYNISTQTWQIVYESDLNLTDLFSLFNQGDITNSQIDASWMLLFTTNNEFYTITSRNLRYIFESDSQLRFYFDKNEQVYTSKSSNLIRDKINILSINTRPGSTAAYTTDFKWDVVSEFIGLDGYVDNKKIVVSFADVDDNGSVDNPDLFSNIIDSDSLYVFQEKYAISTGQDDYRYVNNMNDSKVNIVADETIYSGVAGQYYYFPTTNVVKLAEPSGMLQPTLDYKAYEGRANLKFQYVHNANYDSRIDPGLSNIIDVFILTKGYDTAFRKWVSGAISIKPLPPSSTELYNTVASSLNLIKSISDEVIYHPVMYKILFGASAALELQATFKITKTPGLVVSDNDVKSRVITAINSFFNLDNWDFGDTFFFTELVTYVMNELTPDISNFVIVPRKQGLNFGSLYEIKSLSNEILINGATVDDIEVISGITASNIKTSNSASIDSLTNQQNISSSSYGSI
jgi:hypothetical protein